MIKYVLTETLQLRAGGPPVTKDGADTRDSDQEAKDVCRGGEGAGAAASSHLGRRSHL